MKTPSFTNKKFLNLKFDRQSPLPLYYQLEDQLRKAIRKGRLRPDDRILPEREITKRFGLSAPIINKAFDNLIHEGLIYRVQGKGTFVADLKKVGKLVPILIPDIKGFLYSRMVRGIEDITNENGYMAVLCNSDSDSRKERRYLDRFSDEKVAGMIIVPSPPLVRSGRLLDLIRTSACVVIDKYMPGGKIDCVVSDDISGAYGAVKYLIGLGHRRIVHLSGPFDLSPSQDRLKGYKKALNDYGLIFCEELVKETDYTQGEGYKTTLTLIKSNIQFTAIFAAADTAVIGAYEALREKGLTVPGDVSLVGYGDLDLGQVMVPALTTVHQSFHEMGRVAAKRLITQINGESEISKEKISLPTELIIRGSSGIAKESKN